MMEQPVWLGAARRSTRTAAIGYIALTAVVTVILVIGQFTQDGPLGMYEMLRLKGHPIIYAIPFALTATLFCASLYYSGIRSVIEIERTGRSI